MQVGVASVHGMQEGESWKPNGTCVQEAGTAITSSKWGLPKQRRVYRSKAKRSSKSFFSYTIREL